MGRIVGAYISATRQIPAYLVDTTEVCIQQLHSTKGWRHPYWERWRSATTVPVMCKFHWADGCGPHRERPTSFATVGMRHLARHGWWRRMVRKDGTPEERGYLAAWEEAHAKMRQLPVR